MKKALYIFAFLLTVLVFINCSTASANKVPAAIEIPDGVQRIIDKSCYVCHNTTSKDKKAKKKFDFDKLNYLKKQRALVQWDKVAEMVIEGEMPPKKFNKKHPDKQLSRNEKQILIDWIRGLTEVTEISLDSQMAELVDQIVSSLAQNDKSKIAVMDFVNMSGQTTKLGRYLSEELTTRLYLTGMFEVIERKLLDKIVEEQKISLSGMIDESTAAELGRVLGVDAIASGTITDLGTSVKVNARLISAETGKLFSVASVEITKNDKVKILLSQSVATTAATSSVTSVQAASRQTVKKEGYIFELLEARLEGQTVSCKLKITNTTSGDRIFYLSRAGRKNSTEIFTMLYDDLDNETIVNAIKKGTDVTLMYTYPNFFKKTILSGKSLLIELQFENLSSGVNEIALLQIIFELHPGKVIDFRNIPLNKD